MDFKVVCPGNPDHVDFWVSIPITQYWTCQDGLWKYEGTGKMWNPNETDEYFCQECEEPAEVIASC
jgi:hypothetical protein